MAQVKYLYGAAVQGIQSFIFQTDRLREIVGASELVHEICTDLFDEYALEGEVIQRAAGAIKHVYDDRKTCERTVLNFPKKVMEHAPGITVSQAVVKFVEGGIGAGEDISASFSDAVDELEQKLRVQRNRPFPSVTCGLMGTRRSRTTGLPLVIQDSENRMDKATLKKYMKSREANQELCNWNFGTDRQGLELVYDTGKLTVANDWIAVIHIDGNGLGQIVQKIGKDKEKFKYFSSKLEEVTKESALNSYESLRKGFKKFIPMRPIVLSGDDHTLVCRADLAVSYVKEYLKNFESSSKDKLEDILRDVLPFNHLTACAGIAFVKSSFPFHYAYKMAEELCSRAKVDAKSERHKINGIPCSCLMYHKVQDSFVSSYEDVVARELTPRPELTFEFGPYYYKENVPGTELGKLADCWSINELEINTAGLVHSENGNAIKSGLREWMELLYDGSDIADMKLKRMKSLLSDSDRKLVEKVAECRPVPGKDNVRKVPVYDMSVLYSILNQKTKEVENDD